MHIEIYASRPRLASQRRERASQALRHVCEYEATLKCEMQTLAQVSRIAPATTLPCVRVHAIHAVHATHYIRDSLHACVMRAYGRLISAAHMVPTHTVYTADVVYVYTPGISIHICGWAGRGVGDPRFGGDLCTRRLSKSTLRWS